MQMLGNLFMVMVSIPGEDLVVLLFSPGSSFLVPSHLTELISVN